MCIFSSMLLSPNFRLIHSCFVCFCKKSPRGHFFPAGALLSGLICSSFTSSLKNPVTIKFICTAYHLHKTDVRIVDRLLYAAAAFVEFRRFTTFDSGDKTSITMVAKTVAKKPRESRSLASRHITEIHSRTTKRDREIAELTSKLASRSYHLEEGNSWSQDWLQYQKNTHPLFGICFHHHLHPIGRFQRIIILVGSIAFGLTLTNCVYLGFLKSQQAGTAVNYIYDQAGNISEAISDQTSIEVEQSLFFLWTVGSFLHATFDMLIWYLTACACFRPGGGFFSRPFCQKFGSYLTVLLVVCALFSATGVVVLRLNADTIVEDPTHILDGTGLESTKFSFLLAYSLELVFAFVLWSFVTVSSSLCGDSAVSPVGTLFSFVSIRPGLKLVPSIVL